MNPLESAEFRRQGHMMIDFIADYYKNIETYPVLSTVQPGYLRTRLPESAPNNPEPIETILNDVNQHIIPGLTHWQSPNHFALFPSSASTAGFLGETLAAALNVVGLNWVSSPAATELETIVMDWLGEMLKLPKSFLFSGTGGGVMQGTTCEAIICTLVAARDRKLSAIGRENIGKLVVYGSDQTHSAFQKASRIAGIHPENCRIVETNKATSFSMSPEIIRRMIITDMEAGLVPLFVCATVVTTSTTAVDPLGPISDVAKDYDMWVHVDAAYAGNACICPEFRHFIDGVEGVNSFSFNAHKWLFTTLDCCCLWVKDPNALTRSLSTSPEYLKNKATESKKVVDYKDWQISLSRRFRSLKLWLVLRSYGVEGLQGFIRSHVKMAKQFEALLASDDRFEVVVPRNFSLVCFRVSPFAITKVKLISKNHHHHYEIGNDVVGKKEECYVINGNADLRDTCINEVNKELLESINGSGRVYLSHCVVGGAFALRLAVGSTLTEESHVVRAWNVVKEHADSVLANYI
ncbi:tyrosine decarboxylase-like [Humulus lupulus]|uniref:tyrosine decarboxylase-like n=1 Tax=Humulus lupulus TaxID=3486 RepID=UPI002B410373|nr:tyrosine decarboxylase-like [Humulus lupulus]XP_062119925.1 tyrosine decarboxylase-like [Humulus lupulus]